MSKKSQLINLNKLTVTFVLHQKSIGSVSTNLDSINPELSAAHRMYFRTYSETVA